MPFNFLYGEEAIKVGGVCIGNRVEKRQLRTIGCNQRKM